MTETVQALEGTTAVASNGWKPYPAYKPSGIAWLGDIPAQWREVPFCAICRPKKIVNQRARELLSVYLNRGVVRFSDVDEKRTNPTSEDLSNYQAVDPGDFVLNNQQAWRGSVGVSALSGIVSPAYLVLSLTPEINLHFANLLFRERSMVAQYLKCSKGVGSIQRNLYWPHLKRVTTLLPPSEDQDAIVRFLDYHERLIRKYIRAKQKLIALLTEQKQAIIQHAVTRGLNPDVKLKPSGVDWLGEIPEHWEVLRCKFLFREVDERSATGTETRLSMSQRLGLVPSDQVEERTLVAESAVGSKKCRPDDLVLNRLKAHLGVFALARENGIVSPDYTVFRGSKQICMPFYEAFLKTTAARTELRRRAKGIVEGFWRLYTDDFYDIRVVFPPLEEQVEIVPEIQRRTAALYAAISRAENEIALMREYRTRLTADAVTGKIDVREAAVALPAGEAAPPIDDTDLDETTDAEEALDAD